MPKDSSFDDQKNQQPLSFRISATAEELEGMLAAARAGKLDRLPLEAPDGTVVYVRVDEIMTAPSEPGEAKKEHWTRRLKAPVTDEPNGAKRR